MKISHYYPHSGGILGCHTNVDFQHTNYLLNVTICKKLRCAHKLQTLSDAFSHIASRFVKVALAIKFALNWLAGPQCAGPNLLGRDWLQSLKLNWQDIKQEAGGGTTGGGSRGWYPGASADFRVGLPDCADSEAGRVRWRDCWPGFPESSSTSMTFFSVDARMKSCWNVWSRSCRSSRTPDSSIIAESGRKRGTCCSSITWKRWASSVLTGGDRQVAIPVQSHAARHHWRVTRTAAAGIQAGHQVRQAEAGH